MCTYHDATLQSSLEFSQFVLHVVLSPCHGRGAAIHTPLDTVHARGSILAALGRAQVHLILQLGSCSWISLMVNGTYLHFAEVRLVHVVNHLRHCGFDALALLLDHFAKLFKICLKHAIS